MFKSDIKRGYITLLITYIWKNGVQHSVCEIFPFGWPSVSRRIGAIQSGCIGTLTRQFAGIEGSEGGVL
jgi:hypothetical protein